MKALNSSVNEARRVTYMAGAGMLLAFLFLAPVVASATSYSLSIKTDKALYNSGDTINISGNVSASGGSLPAGTAVGLKITSSAGTLVDINQASVGSNGAYSATFKATYPVGTYTITASWAPNASATAITATANFQMNGTTSSAVSGVTTTIFASTTTTVIEAPVTTTVVSAATTTVVQQQQTTTTVNSVVTTQTTVTESPTTDSTALAVGAVGVIIAIVAIVLVVLTMRKKK